MAPRFSYGLEIVGRVQAKIGGGEVLSAIPDFPVALPTQKAGHHSQNLMSPAPSMALLGQPHCPAEKRGQNFWLMPL